MTTSAQAWQRMLGWAATIVMVTLIGLWGGQGLGEVLHRESYDYIVVVDEFSRWGVRIGLLGGALIAGVQVVGTRAMAHPARALAAALLFAIVTALGCALGALALYGAYRTGAGSFAHWQLPNPSRHAVLAGAVAGRDLGAAIGVLLAMVYVLDARGLATRRIALAGSLLAAMWVALAWSRPPLSTLLGVATMADGAAAWAGGMDVTAMAPRYPGRKATVS